MRDSMFCAVVVLSAMMVQGCTASHVYVNNGKGNQGKRTNMDAKIRSTIESKITGIETNELQDSKSTSPQLH